MEENGTDRRPSTNTDQVTRDFLGMFLQRKGLSDRDDNSYRFSISKDLVSNLPGVGKPETNVGSIEDKMVPSTRKYI